MGALRRNLTAAFQLPGGSVKLRPALAGLGLLLAAAAPGATADEAEVLSERINFNIGCNQENGAPTCATTQFWLGTNVGTNSVGQNGAVTPLDWATHKSSGEYRTTAFPSDNTLDPSGYVLIGESVVKGRISTGGFLGGAEVSADSGVFVRLTGRVAKLTGTGTDPLNFGQVEVTKAAVTPSLATPGSTVYEFSFTVPKNMDGRVLRTLNADVGQRHITVLQNGFIDGEGGSYLDLPHREPAS
jgi:hypothetical protein